MSQGSGEGAGRRQREARLHASPKLLVTGFGPFPNAPKNPTEALVMSLSQLPPEDLGAGAIRALVLPTDYRRSWPMLRRAAARLNPDIVVHFGLAVRSESIRLERLGRKRVDPDKPDAAGFAPRSGVARRSGPEVLEATLPNEAIEQALLDAGIAAACSDDAGAYVCNATLYRSLHAQPPGSRRMVGFVHVPAEDAAGFTRDRLLESARLVLTTAASVWSANISASC